MNIRKYLRDKGGIVGTWVIIILVTLFIASSSLWFFVYRTDNKYLSIINLYPYDIKLKIFNQDIKLKRFDTYVRIYNTKEDINVEVYKDSEDTELRLKSLSFTDLKRESQLIEVALSENENICFLTAVVTNAYYNTDFSFEDVQINSVPGKNYIITDINPNSSYVYLGNSIQSVFPKNRVSLTGIYPIDCTKSSDANNQARIIKLYQNYNPEEQRTYFDEQLKKIQNAGSLDELNKI